MDFNTMSGPQLATVWNEMVLTAIDLGLPEVKPVKKFSDPKTGRMRCEQLHALIQNKAATTEIAAEATQETPAADPLDIPAALDRKKNGIKPVPRGTPLPSVSTVVEKSRDWRIPKGMSDEEGEAMLKQLAEEKKAKAAERINLMLAKKAEREAEKLAEVNAKREAKGLAPLASLSTTTKTKENVMAKNAVKKSAVKKVAVKGKAAKKTVRAASNGHTNGTKRVSNDAVITRLEAGKDYAPRKGTASAKWWDLITNNMKVSAFKEKKGNLAYLRWFAAHDYVKIS